jgi:dihydrofolate reductase
MAGLDPAIHVFDLRSQFQVVDARDIARHDEQPIAPVMIEIVLVAAIAENGVIGRGNALPWRVRSDLKHFRALTLDKPVIIGRKTFLSIGKPLSGRTTIVVSRDRNFAGAGIVVASGLDAALATARGDALRRGANTIVVAGGAEIYAQAMAFAARLVITRVHKKVDGDAHFPLIDPKIWRETAREEHAPTADDEAAFAFVNYVRIN